MNPYLSKGFAPVENEIEIDELVIEGNWPREISGTLYRIGPNPRFTPIPPYNPLMGDGMVHAFNIAEGVVSYRNRWVRTRQWELENEAGRALFSTSGDPRLHDPSVAGVPTDGVANTNVAWHAGRLLALEEGHPPIELEASTLETKRVWTFGERLRNNMTAHPKIDPDTGEMIFFANEPGRRFNGEIVWYLVNERGEVLLERRIEAPFSSIVHDFAVTRDFVVFLTCPLTISVSRAVAGGPPLAWEPERSTRIGVTRRDGSDDIRWFEKAPSFVWHVVNAWNDGDRITIDVCEQQAPAFPRADGSTTRPASWRQRFNRWVLDPSGRIESRRMSDQVSEYPRIDERHAMQPTRHSYFSCHGGPGTEDLFHRGIAHFDHGAARMRTFSAGKTCAVSEPVFVPTSETAAEGDGWLLCVIYDEANDHSHLALFDAQRIERGPVARAMVGRRVPMGFHGCWVGSAG